MRLRDLLRMDASEVEDWMTEHKQSFLVLEFNRVPSHLGVKPEHWGKALLVQRGGQYHIERVVHAANANEFSWYRGDVAFQPDANIDKYVVLEHDVLNHLLLENKFDDVSDFVDWVAEYQGRAMLLPVLAAGGLTSIQDPDDERMWIVSSHQHSVKLQSPRDMLALCRDGGTVAARLPLRLQD